MSIKLDRIGYGSVFNDLYINNNEIKKQSISEYGDNKIKKEMIFYKYIHNNNIPFRVPSIYEYGYNYYTMEYLKDYQPLYKYFSLLSPLEQENILNTIHSELKTLHHSKIYPVDKYTIGTCLFIETTSKILERYKDIESITEKYSFIKRVNGIKIDTFDNIMSKLQIKIAKYIDSLNNYEMCVIHGDCQFNNILYNPIDKSICFIDPRGYFGNNDLYGISDYDYAKVRFALSGYDIFDNMDITTLNIQDEDNLIIDNIMLRDNIFTDDIISTLTISIWLGNAHCFKNNIPKAMFSYFYALYLSTLYL